MAILGSSTARLMLAAATLATALVAMREQDEGALRVLTGLVAVWLVIATSEATLRSSRDRAFWRAFLVAAGASLALSFGPWSDAATRGQPPTSGLPKDWAAWRGGLTPATRVALAASRAGLVPDARRQVIETLDRAGRVVHRVSIATAAGASPAADELALGLNQGVFDGLHATLARQGGVETIPHTWDRSGGSVTFTPAPGSDPRAVVAFRMAHPVVSPFMDAWHLLFAMALGWLAAGCVVAWRLARGFAAALRGGPPAVAAGAEPAAGSW